LKRASPSAPSAIGRRTQRIDKIRIERRAEQRTVCLLPFGSWPLTSRSIVPRALAPWLDHG
jgi:hypothetical protein